MNPGFGQRRSLISWFEVLWFVWLATGLHYTTLADELQARPGDTIRATFGERETSATVAGPPRVTGVRILGKAADGTLVIGQVLRVEVEFDRAPAEEEISVTVSLDEQSLTVSARRFSIDPPLYESEPIELMRGGQDGEARTLIARHGAMEDQAPVDGLTPGALADYLAELAVKAAEAGTALEAALLSQEIAALLEGIDHPAILEFVADALQSLAPHSAHPPSLDLISRITRSRRDDLLNKTLDERLSVLAQGIEDGTHVERKAFALLKEATLVHALQQLAQLSQFKRGEGLIADTSFMALSSGEMMERLRTTPQAQLDEFLTTNGVAANEDYREALRDLMVDASVKLQRYENELELNRKAKARGFDDLTRNELDFEQWVRERRRLEDETRTIEAERERLLREIPILRLRGQEVRRPGRSPGKLVRSDQFIRVQRAIDCQVE